MNTELTDVEAHFLHEFEESDEDLYLLEIDVRCHFSDSDTSPEEIRRIAKETIKSLVRKEMIELNAVHYKQVAPNSYDVSRVEKLPTSEIEPFLRDEASWTKDLKLSEEARRYFHPTELGIKALDRIQTEYEKQIRDNRVARGVNSPSSHNTTHTGP